MTTPQLLSVSLVAVMMAAFLWGRLRYDIVAMLALLAGVAIGIIPAGEAFKGFSDDIIIIVGSALVLSAAVARSRVIERGLSRVMPALGSTQAQVVLLVLSVAVLSAIIKNIGALAMMLPIAYQLARKGGRSPSVFLMPMAFASLLGGIVTLVGTSPNVIVARVRAELGGQPFSMFDFTPVGIVVALAGCAFLALGYRLLPQDRRGAVSLDQAIDIKDYVTEARIGQASALAGRTVADLKALGGGDLQIVAILRDERRLQAPLPDASLKSGDTLLLRGDAAVLERVVAEGGLDLDGQHRPIEKEDALDPDQVSEAIIGPNSVLIGQSAGDIGLHARFGVNMIAISRAGERFTQRLRDIRLRAGDIVVIQGDEKQLPEKLMELGLLPLADRVVSLGSTRKAVLTVSIVLAAVVTLAFGLAPVPLTFFAAAVLLIALRCLPLREAYGSIDAPILRRDHPAPDIDQVIGAAPGAVEKEHATLGIAWRCPDQPPATLGQHMADLCGRDFLFANTRHQRSIGGALRSGRRLAQRGTATLGGRIGRTGQQAGQQKQAKARKPHQPFSSLRHIAHYLAVSAPLGTVRKSGHKTPHVITLPAPHRTGCGARRPGSRARHCCTGSRTAQGLADTGGGLCRTGISLPLG